MYVRTYTSPWYSKRNRTVLRRRKAERRTAAVISSRRDWPSRGTRGSVGGQWRSGLGFSRILPPEIRRVLCATYTRARTSSMYTKLRLFQPQAHIHQGRCPPVARVHHRHRRSNVQLFRIFHPRPTPRQPRSPSGPSFPFLTSISPGSISDSRHNDSAFSPLSETPRKLEWLMMVVRCYKRKKTRSIISQTHFRITWIEFISFYKFLSTHKHNYLYLLSWESMKNRFIL